jgi:glycosyltransferase involved in cell wall biosynthesis
METVTLTMPVYNVAPYIEKSLLSALDQTYEEIEFIVVDDKGTDNSMEIVRKVIDNHPRGKAVKIIEHPINIGLGAGRNSAIDNALGEYIFFMDSDDEITPDCIQKLYDEMQRSDVDFVQGSMINLYPDNVIPPP